MMKILLVLAITVAGLLANICLIKEHNEDVKYRYEEKENGLNN